MTRILCLAQAIHLASSLKKNHWNARKQQKEDALGDVSGSTCGIRFINGNEAQKIVQRNSDDSVNIRRPEIKKRIRRTDKYENERRQSDKGPVRISWTIKLSSVSKVHEAMQKNTKGIRMSKCRK